MKGTFKGYDPELGKKFAAEYGGLVIGRGRSLPKKSEEQVRQEYVEEHGRDPDPQQLHDAMMGSSVPQSAAQKSKAVDYENPSAVTHEEELEDGVMRLAKMQHQNAQLRKKPASKG